MGIILGAENTEFNGQNRIIAGYILVILWTLPSNNITPNLLIPLVSWVNPMGAEAVKSFWCVRKYRYTH